MALLFSLHQWGARAKADKSEMTSDADKNLLDVSKRLLVSKEFKAVGDYLLDTKRYVLGWSVPSFFRDGCYLFRLSRVQAVEDELTMRRDMLRGLINTLLDVYPSQIDSMAARLGAQFRRADYPSTDELSRAFYWSYQWVSFDVPDRLPDAIKAQEKAKVENMWAEAAESITFALRESFAKMVSHAVEVMQPSTDGKQKRFYDSTVTNILDFLQSFQERNITNDTELAALVDKAKSVLVGIEDASMLKKDGLFRGRVLDEFKKLDTALDGLVQVRPGRKFNFED